MLALARRLREWPGPRRFARSVASALALATPDDRRLRAIYEAAVRAGPPPSLRPAMTHRPLPVPGAFEQRFARFQREGRYSEMWSLLADDAQRVWGDPSLFAERMRGEVAGVELLDADVEDVDVLPEWTDIRTGRTYRNVARLGVSYRVKHGQRQWALKRQVHWVTAADGWRMLCYPVAE
jgi:hypothetical protein